MKYLVGGAVRDRLLGLDPKDLDWVHVGVTVEEMTEAGYKNVGKAFPVFRHPATGDEHALARKERSTGNGYKDFEVSFDPTVTLEEDLGRRDLTINAIAVDDAGNFVDPFGGRDDLSNKILRALPDAFEDDPVRALRLARFAARFPEFTIDPNTLSMVKGMDLSGLEPNRVWKELERALGEEKPSRFFDVLKGTGVFPEIDYLETAEQPPLWHPEGDAYIHTMMGIDITNSKRVRYAVLCHDLGKPIMFEKTGKLHGHERAGLKPLQALCDRYNVPNSYRGLAEKVTEYHTHCHKGDTLKPSTTLKVLNIVGRDIWDFCLACDADKSGRTEPRGSEPYPQPEYLKLCHASCEMVRRIHVDPKFEGPSIGRAIERLKQRIIGLIKQWYQSQPENSVTYLKHCVQVSDMVEKLLKEEEEKWSK